jgi:hypothetical protein
MKCRYLLPGLLAAGVLLVFGGCRKAELPPRMQEYYGVQVIWPQMDSDFANAGPELQDDLSQVKRAFRYANFAQALPALEKLSKAPNLTPAQQKLVSTLIDQTKQVLAKMPPAGQ